MNNRIYLIYRYISPSGKSYIGQTKHLDKRHREHQSPHSECRAFKNAIEKYGMSNFTREILANNLTLEEANTLEEQYISSYNTLAPNGYNLKTGGFSQLHSEETKQLQSQAKIGEQNPNFGKVGAMLGRVHTSESRAKISAKKAGEKHHMFGKRGTMTGRKHSPETIEKLKVAKTDEQKRRMSEGSKGQNIGRPMSPETKAKILATKAAKAAKKAAKLLNSKTESHEKLFDNDV